MFNRVYKRLILNSYRPYLLSKLNLWNILNTKHTNVGPLSVIWYIQGCTSLRVKSISTLHPRKLNQPHLVCLILVTLYIPCAVIYIAVL